MLNAKKEPTKTPETEGGGEQKEREEQWERYRAAMQLAEKKKTGDKVKEGGASAR